MTSSTTQSLQVFYVPLLFLVTLHIVTGNDIMASATEMEADTGSKDGTVLPAAREGIYSSSRKLLQETPTKEDAPGRRRRSADPAYHSVIKTRKWTGYMPPTGTVVFLVILLILIALALVFFYKRLNRQTGGQYAPAKLLNEAREGVQNMVVAMEGRLGRPLSPRTGGGEEAESKEDEEAEEYGDEEGSKDPECPADVEQREEDSSDDYSSMEGFEVQGTGHRASKRKRASQEKKEEKKTEVTDEGKEGKKKAEEEEEQDEDRQGGQEGQGLLADLKEISGSAIWAEDEKTEGEKDSCDLTEL